MNLFLLAAIPGLAAVVISFLLKDNTVKVKEAGASRGFRPFAFLNYWHTAPASYRRVAIGLLFFSFINSSDVFLLLQLKAHGYSDREVVLAYIFYNLIYVVAAYPMGHAADRFGPRRMLILGFAFFTLTYGGFAIAEAYYQFILLLAIYGLFAAATEGVSKAWISNIAGKSNTATAIGNFSALQSVATLLASSIAGFVWYSLGPAFTFASAAIGGVALVIYFLLIKPLARPG